MSSSYRIYVGNLPPSVSEEELKSKFQSFCSKVGDEGLEIKNKNDSTFAYLNLYVDEPPIGQRNDPLKFEQLPDAIRKCIAVMNNTKWKGNLIKVQLAKESFLSKLKKEQDDYKTVGVGSRKPADGEFKNSKADQLIKNDNDRPAFHHDEKSSKLLALAGMAPIAPPSNYHSEDRNHRGIAKAQQHTNRPDPDYDFEIVSSNKQSAQMKKPPKATNSKSKNKRAAASDSSDSETDVKEGFIPKFRGLLTSFSDTTNNTTEQKEEQSLQVESPAVETSKEVVPETKGIKFNAFKRQKSNDLRLKSMDDRFVNEKKKTDFIQNSLKHVQNTVSESVSSASGGEKKSKKATKSMVLFKDEEEDDGATDFAVKDQFEGESGQKLLELKSKWNFDERFRIDDRFKESHYGGGGDEVEEELQLDKEKEEEMKILNQMFGREVVGKKKSRHQQDKSNSDFAIVPRYDPDLEDHKEKYEQKIESAPKNNGTMSKKGNKNSEEEKQTIGSSVTAAVNEPVKKVEYKVASNLKSLFSTDSTSTSETKTDNQTGQFSLLSAFGNADNDQDRGVAGSGHDSQSKEEPRKFWQSNPFKYDSSDEDEEADPLKSKKPVTKQVNNVFKTKKDTFFFKVKDSRFDCIKKFFLEPDEDFSTVQKNYNETDRAELRHLIKAKIKNSRRKSEKRDEALKRLKRKLKMKHKQVRKNNKKKFAFKQ